MKHKFSKILGIGLTLALLISMLVVAAPVQATATAVTDVWVDFPSADNPNVISDTSGANDYLVHFKPNIALSRGADWVTVTFPDGVDSDMGPTSSGDFTVSAVAKAGLKFSTNFGTAFSATWVTATVNATIIKNRVKVRMPIDVAAGADVWLSIKSTGVDSNSAVSNSYKVYVQTTQDTTRVLSSAFSLDGTDITDTNDALVVTPDTVGVAAEYKLVFRPTTAGATTVTVKLPMGVGMPSSMDVTEVKFSLDGDSWFNASSTPVIDVDRRTVTAATALGLATGADNYMKIIQGAGITNPTTAGAAYEALMKTTDDAQWLLLDDETTIVADTATKLVFVASTSDNATIVNALTQVITLESHDQYGNLKAVTGTTVLVATDGTGTVNTAAAGSAAPWGASQTHSSGTDNVYYLPTAVGTGTHTLTATVVSGTSLASDTIDISVVPKVVLTDGDGNELGTYGPSVSYTANILSGTYIQNAITAAGAGDTVTLGDGTYESVDGGIDIDKAITLTSVNGRDSTIIRSNESTTSSLIALTSTATISGLHLMGWFPGQTVDYSESGVYGIYVDAVGSATSYGIIKDNKIEGYYTGIAVSGGTRNYWKIQDNVFDNCRSGIYSVGAQYWTISGNTFTNYIAGVGGTGSVQNYTVKNNSFNGINSSANSAIVGLVGQYGNEGVGLAVSHATVVFTQNTFTGNDYGIRLYADSPATVVKYNDFIDNNLFGVGGDGAYEVAALYNWWGDATGPSTGTGAYKSTAAGSGDAIGSGHEAADYSSWLHKSKVDVVADNASYITLTRSLSVGWNTLSVPAKLISAANSLDELVPTGRVITYKYVGGWVEVLATDVINPLDGIYVKMSSAQTVLLKVDGAALSAPTKSLAAGWNLVGLASLATKTDLLVADLLPSASFGQLVSPSMNAGNPWALISGDTSSEGTLAIGEGYWLFMKSAATMAAFDVLPLVPDFN